MHINEGEGKLALFRTEDNVLLTLLHNLFISFYFIFISIFPPPHHRPLIDPTLTLHWPHIYPTSTLHRTYIDPTLTLHRTPYIDPTSTLYRPYVDLPPSTFLPPHFYCFPSSSLLFFSLLFVLFLFLLSVLGFTSLLGARFLGSIHSNDPRRHLQCHRLRRGLWLGRRHYQQQLQVNTFNINTVIDLK